MVCNIQGPLTKEEYPRDPRGVARKAVNHMRSAGVADTAYFGPELELFVFDEVRHDQTPHPGYYHPDPVEGAGNAGRDGAPGLGRKPRYEEGFFPRPPSDALHGLRPGMTRTTMVECGLKVEARHHGVATDGRGEIDRKYAPPAETAGRPATSRPTRAASPGGRPRPVPPGKESARRGPACGRRPARQARNTPVRAGSSHKPASAASPGGDRRAALSRRAPAVRRDGRGPSRPTAISPLPSGGPAAGGRAPGLGGVAVGRVGGDGHGHAVGAGVAPGLAALGGRPAGAEAAEDVPVAVEVGPRGGVAAAVVGRPGGVVEARPVGAVDRVVVGGGGAVGDVGQAVAVGPVGLGQAGA
jgi:hypothetical protein